MYRGILETVRAQRPLVHCISNHVTSNDCANILLAAGASPIMAEAPEEAAEITAMCNGLVINMGVPNPAKIEAMLISGAEAKKRSLPVVFDPVGVGSSRFRYESAMKIIENVRPSVIRANAGEVAALLNGCATRKGVDNDGETVPDRCMQLAKDTGAVVLCTGSTDVVTDGVNCFLLNGGSELMRLVTGAGCQLSALTGAFVAANCGDILHAALAAAWVMNHCGEKAFLRMETFDGNASLRNYIIDAVCNLRTEEMEEMEYEVLL